VQNEKKKTRFWINQKLTGKRRDHDCWGCHTQRERKRTKRNQWQFITHLPLLLGLIISHFFSFILS